MQEPHEDFADAMEAFLTHTARTTSGSRDNSAKLAGMLEGGWLHSAVRDLPRQQDGVHCGVFAMVFADCLAAGFPLCDCPLQGGALRASRAHIAEALLQVGPHVLAVGSVCRWWVCKWWELCLCAEVSADVMATHAYASLSSGTAKPCCKSFACSV